MKRMEAMENFHKADECMKNNLGQNQARDNPKWNKTPSWSDYGKLGCANSYFQQENGCGCNC